MPTSNFNNEDHKNPWKSEIKHLTCDSRGEMVRTV